MRAIINEIDAARRAGVPVKVTTVRGESIRPHPFALRQQAGEHLLAHGNRRRGLRAGSSCSPTSCR